MKKKTYSSARMAVISAAAIVATPSAYSAVLTTVGNIGVAGNWDTGVLPGTGEIATVGINASWPNTSAAGNLMILGDLVFDGGITLTAATDIVGFRPNSVTFNSVTVNVGDDIFTGGATGNFIFNAGSITNVDDDFEANGGGTITVNGGTHTTDIASPNTGNFGAQNNSTLNFFGGTVDTALFRTTQNGTGTQFGTINLGGNATLTSDAISLAANGVFDISSAWTGSLTIPTFMGTDWDDIVIPGMTLDGVAVDASSFATDFLVSNDGQTLSLINPIPEPSTALLGGLGAFALLARRRK